MKTVQVCVPDMGDFDEVDVIEHLIHVGDTIDVEQSLITVESNKASMEIPSSHAGVVKSLMVKLGDKVKKGSVIAELEVCDVVNQISDNKSQACEVVTVSTQVPAHEQSAGILPHASPAVRKLARELEVDLSRVVGTANKGRITREDVHAFAQVDTPASALVKEGSAGFSLLSWPSLDFSKFGATELLPLSRIKKISGPNLHRNWVTIPHVTQFDQVDITALEAFRKETNAAFIKRNTPIKLTLLAFVIKACVKALQKFSALNASLDASGDHLIVKQYYHIGFAADTPQGLVVPVIKEADKKSINIIAQEMGTLSAQAREGKLMPSHMQGASFTISSLGGIGGTAFTPIINAPEVAILGLSKAVMQPVWNDQQFVPRLMLPLSLSYDHRVIDGATGARFITYLCELLADMRKILL